MFSVPFHKFTDFEPITTFIRSRAGRNFFVLGDVNLGQFEYLSWKYHEIIIIFRPIAQFKTDIGVDIKFLIFLYSIFVKFHTKILKYFQTNTKYLIRRHHKTCKFFDESNETIARAVDKVSGDHVDEFNVLENRDDGLLPSMVTTNYQETDYMNIQESENDRSKAVEIFPVTLMCADSTNTQAV